jgi:hypothetical protein
VGCGVWSVELLIEQAKDKLSILRVGSVYVLVNLCPMPGVHEVRCSGTDVSAGRCTSLSWRVRFPGHIPGKFSGN